MRAMKQYLLLRNNVQSGPYTLEALIEQNLRSLDLIWKEEESTAWHYATEMDELKEHVNDQVKHEETVSENKIYVALPDLQPCGQPVARQPSRLPAQAAARGRCRRPARSGR